MATDLENQEQNRPPCWTRSGGQVCTHETRWPATSWLWPRPATIA